MDETIVEKQLAHEAILVLLRENITAMVTNPKCTLIPELAHAMSGARSALTAVLIRMEMSEEHHNSVIAGLREIQSDMSHYSTLHCGDIDGFINGLVERL